VTRNIPACAKIPGAALNSIVSPLPMEWLQSRAAAGPPPRTGRLLFRPAVIHARPTGPNTLPSGNMGSPCPVYSCIAGLDPASTADPLKGSVEFRAAAGPRLRGPAVFLRHPPSGDGRGNCSARRDLAWPYCEALLHTLSILARIVGSQFPGVHRRADPVPGCHQIYGNVELRMRNGKGARDAQRAIVSTRPHLGG